MSKSNLRHVDVFSGASYSVNNSTVVVGAANDVGGPFDDGIRSQATCIKARDMALATLDVLTVENFATYAALMSA